MENAERETYVGTFPGTSRTGQVMRNWLWQGEKGRTLEMVPLEVIERAEDQPRTARGAVAFVIGMVLLAVMTAGLMVVPLPF